MPLGLSRGHWQHAQKHLVKYRDCGSWGKQAERQTKGQTDTLISRGVVVNFDLGERFPRPRSQQRGSLRPRARRVAVLGVGAGGVEIFDAKSRVWGNLGHKINWSRVNLSSTTWFAGTRFSVSVPPVANDICRSAVPAPTYLPERRSTAPLHPCSSVITPRSPGVSAAERSNKHGGRY